jgi:hypothetical protein
MKFFEDQNILTDYQHGLRKKRSCESQLITTIKELASGIDSSTQIDAILFAVVFTLLGRSLMYISKTAVVRGLSLGVLQT